MAKLPLSIYLLRQDRVVLVCAVLSLLLRLGWLIWFTPDWVRIAADAYAERLLAACEKL